MASLPTEPLAVLGEPEVRRNAPTASLHLLEILRPRRVVVVRASRIGDFVCATPAFRALRRTLPDAELTLVGLPLVRGLAERLGYFDTFLEFPGWPGIAEQLYTPANALAFFAAAQEQQFDLAIQLHGSGVNANPFTLLLGARATVGFVRPGDSEPLLAAVLPLPQAGHEVERVLALPELLGAAGDDRGTECPLLPQDRESARALLQAFPRPWIGLHPGAADADKRWPLNSFAAVATAQHQRLGGTLVLLGDTGERAGCRFLAQEVMGPCLYLAGRVTLPLAAAVIETLNLLVSNDSGPAHIAYALGTPSVTIFMSTDPARWGPPPHSGPQHRWRWRPYWREVAEVAQGLLEEGGRGRIQAIPSLKQQLKLS